MIKYEARAWSTTAIMALNVVSETAKTVNVLYKSQSGNEIIRRQNKDGADTWIRDTFDEAKKCLIEYREDQLRRAKEKVDSIENSLAVLHKLKKEDVGFPHE